ncbi:response regulator [Pseudomonas cavernae]|uniref:Response regulator n=1 Tax=Pseudomonas cavernae TaxID=2320867 RepID=A0A385Z8V9_9PSED|nr:response regulator [Pseudomonas cavernae]AYC34052.1 response regulator [Pseudomonas cavernae]
MTHKILIVEDEPILAQNLKAYLETRRCEVRIAHDGASAIGLAQGFAADLMVVDFRLPDMEGFQVVEAFRRRVTCQCVLITGHPSGAVRDGAARHGIGHILFKPFPLGELWRVVQSVLSSGTGESASAAPPELFAERRRNAAEGFPLQMYDGSWVLAERRHPAPSAPAAVREKQPSEDEHLP